MNTTLVLARARQRSAVRDPGALLEWAVFGFFLAALCAKVSYFNFPWRETGGNEWYAWQFRETVKACAGSLGLLLVLCAPLLWVRPARRFAILCALNLGITLLVVSDVVHFRYFGDVVSMSAVSTGWQLGLVYRSVLALLRPTDLLFFADLAALLLFRPYLRAAAAHTPPVRRAVVGWLAAAGLLLVAAGPVRTIVRDDGGTFRYTYFRFFGVRKIGLLNYHFYEAGRSVHAAFASAHAVTAAERESARAFVKTWREEATAPSPLFGAARGKNVIFIMVESLHAFPLGMRVGGREVTPNLNALARRSMYFESFYGQTWEGSTSDGEWTSLQSLHPLPSGSVSTTYPTHHFRGIPRVLAERGYTTLSAHAYYGDLWGMREMHPNLGFQRSYFRESYSAAEPMGMGGIPDADFFRQTAPRLRELPRPFMAYLMTITTHHPYRLHDRYKVLPMGDLAGTTVADYLHTVHYTDAALGEFVAGLERDGILDESVLVIYGDHKGDLGEPAGLERLLTRDAGFAPRAPGFDARYWREQNRLPLLIHLPGDSAAGVRTTSAGHLDIAPTVLNLLGIRDHGMTSLGRDLTQGKPSLVVLRNGGFVLQDTVCVVPDAAVSTRRCAELRTGRDLDTARFAPRYGDARKRLLVSDLLIRADAVR